MNSFSCAIEGNIATFKIEGDFVQSLTEPMRRAIRDAVEGGATTVQIDLNDSKHIDSPSIGLLLATFNTLKKTGGELVILRVSPAILDLFRILQLDKRFKIC